MTGAWRHYIADQPSPPRRIRAFVFVVGAAARDGGRVWMAGIREYDEAGRIRAFSSSSGYGMTWDAAARAAVAMAARERMRQ